VKAPVRRITTSDLAPMKWIRAIMRRHLRGGRKIQQRAVPRKIIIRPPLRREVRAHSPRSQRILIALPQTA
jgi:hypothetical protein